ncbi:PP2C family protein-serine/threonine phosphatase [Thiorhodovibrio frisius]|uniref:Serine phosphatase RsbU, regulator of sigma subunit n=1 Tax=Thiorhodovibrio frisius TaxID=631362 RepID=H8YYQ7_9GAMM|nr:SpoIIE family protein phosphatase [Thiorhodovibrio frisius]EIC23583.1 serine phosphatase RsbU, regulator of sigma subunit [Thiorhodovibrio frisius]WPL23330.1 sensory histidine kinase CreC [Thiorhodovibrio frisius]
MKAPTEPLTPHPDLANAQVTFWRGLTFKQATITLLVVSLLSLSTGAAQLYLQWRGMRADLQAEIDRTLALVRGSAAEAAFQMHPELARQLINGLHALPALAAAELRDNFGQVLAEIKPASASPPTVLVRALAPSFADILHYRLVLHDPQSAPEASTEPGEPIGTLSLELSANALAASFLVQARNNLLVTTVQILLVSALVVAVFYWMITRPILRLSDAITEVDPGAPGYWTPPRLRGHQRDELGMLNLRMGALLSAFQQGLNQRDVAEQDLRALTQELEARVQERTCALHSAMQDLDQQKSALEQAFGELDSTHARLADANDQLLASINYARRIQNAILPASDRIRLHQAEIAVHWEPLQAVGGDWYWFESLANQPLIVLADCTGHGVPGALMTLVVASALERILHEQKLRDPVEILYALDDLVRKRMRQDAHDSVADDGLEAAVLCLNPDCTQARFASAGIALIQLDADDRVKVYRGGHAHLGYASLPPPRRIELHRLEIAPGDLCLLLSDGVTDQMGGEPQRLLGRRRFIERLKRSRKAKLHDWMLALEQALAAYRGEQARRDDMTLIAIHKND